MPFEINKSNDSEHQMDCIRCLTPTRHTVLASVKENTGTDDDRLWILHEIVRCEGCYSVSFRKEVNEASWYDADGIVRDVERTVAIYPIRRKGKRQISKLYLPPDIHRVYHETWIALSNDQNVLAGIGIRALIESVCKHKKAIGRNLESKIDNLVEKGVLTKDGSRILHALRILGNQAAHEVEPHSHSTLDTAMDVVDNLLTNVYVLPKKARSLLKRTAT